MNDKLRKFSPSVRQVSTTILGDKSMLHLGPVALCATSLYIEITEYILKRFNLYYLSYKNISGLRQNGWRHF